MASRESFENLIEGLAGAVVEAQRRIEDRQLLNVLRYFDKDRRPKTLDVRVPSPDPYADASQDVVYRVPLLPLIAGSLLRIKEVEIQFDADLVGVQNGKDDKTPPSQADKDGEKGRKPTDKGKEVSVDIRGGLLKGRTGTVHVVLKVEGRELSEGMARLVDRLIQVQADVKPE